ncbi:IS110 family transposase [Demequina iriomotensis]|uniref:IS110 family transposase n=1 Tax=Demequina iriomotensis TaxID=1536641 RepID=UPI000783AFE3|nr:IS110 family transposase [Demequina iriomotensis]
MTAQPIIGEDCLVAGVDTHADTHHVALIDSRGRRVADRQVDATPDGHRDLIAFLDTHGVVACVGIEGTNSYGAALSRHLRATGFTVAEVIRPKRAQRRRGKSDPIDAYAAAAQALSDDRLPIPKDGDGPVARIRALLVVRRSAVHARADALRQLSSLLVTAPDEIRARWRHHSKKTLVKALMRTRPGDPTLDIDTATGYALRTLAHRITGLGDEITDLEAHLAMLVRTTNPALAAARGIGTITAAQLLVTAGDNPSRIRTDPAFAALCGVAPIPASSGKTTKHRLNRGGDRQANWALHTIVLNRMSNDPRTQAYIARRTAEGKDTRDIMRCLKRIVAREVFHLLVHPAPLPAIDDLRTRRQARHIRLDDAAHALGIGIATLSRLERGITRNDTLATTYRQWLTAA